MKSPAVGGDIDCWCNRCELVLAHTIEAMVGSKIKRVHCNTCKQQHAYRARPPGEKAPRAAGAPRAAAPRRARSAAPRPPDYGTLMETRDQSAARPYSPAEIFDTDALVMHPQFGVGIVTARRDPKVDVLFAAGARTLVHGRGGTPRA